MNLKTNSKKKADSSKIKLNIFTLQTDQIGFMINRFIF